MRLSSASAEHRQDGAWPWRSCRNHQRGKRRPSRSPVLGAVGMNWQVMGFGNFSSMPGETDMILRNSNTGGVEVYDIQLTGAAFNRHGGFGLAVRGHRPGARTRCVRSRVAQCQHRRIRGLRHRRQSAHGSRIVRPSRLGLPIGEMSFCARSGVKRGLPMQAVGTRKNVQNDPILTRSAAGLAGWCEKRGLWPDFEEESHVRRRTDGERQSRHR